MSYLLKLLLEKYDLRFEMDSAGTGKVSFCEHRCINISCRFIIKQFKLKVKNFNNIFSIHQSDKCGKASSFWYQTPTHTCQGPNFPPTTWSWKDLLESWYSPMHVAQLQWHSYPGEDAGMTPTFHQCICSLWDLCPAVAGTTVSSDQTRVPMCPQ